MHDVRPAFKYKDGYLYGLVTNMPLYGPMLPVADLAFTYGCYIKETKSSKLSISRKLTAEELQDITRKYPQELRYTAAQERLYHTK